ncbi:MAG: type II CRISPR-associated endonuclease Cas1 [Bacteroidales bacterium]|nr:type II CRISPR-associated endonuclease Cas1 [Bacteroidales bacterium]
MIKRTICFSHPAYISLRNAQLVVKLEPHDNEPENQASIPIEDIGVVVLDHRQITITHGALSALVNNNAAVITCNDSHMPLGLLLPLDGNTVQSQRFQHQISASLPLRKQLWQQTIQQKIYNQATLLNQLHGIEVGNMRQWGKEVRSGDSTNLEGRAAAFYWSQMFPSIPNFTRSREGDYPNTLLNYGYAILRAVIARALVGSGLLPTLGIHHHNRYNAYCLADDIMEPYRPYVDQHVVKIMKDCRDIELTTEIKRRMLSIPTIEVHIGGQRSPLMVAASTTSASLARCFTGESRRITYPEM